MSERKQGIYFSCNADGSAHDFTIYVEAIESDQVRMGARYKNAERNHIYETILDASDLHHFGEMCIDLSHQLMNGASCDE